MCAVRIGVRFLAVAWLTSLTIFLGVGVASAAQDTQIDDPNGLLGQQREAVERAVSGGALRIVAVVPSLDGEAAARVLADRFDATSPGGQDLDFGLLLVTDERTAFFGVREPALLTGALEPLAEDMQ